jgi:hypothetical protein
MYIKFTNEQDAIDYAKRAQTEYDQTPGPLTCITAIPIDGQWAVKKLVEIGHSGEEVESLEQPKEDMELPE